MTAPIKYAKYVSPHEVAYPTGDEFAGVPNWRYHYALLKRHNYLPLAGTPEDRPGFEAVPVEFMLFPGDRIDIVRWDYRAIPPEPIPDTTERDNAEKAIVAAIKALAVKYDALDDLKALNDITIPTLTELAVEKGVPMEEFGALITGLTPYKWQLEAVVGLTWAECWEGLKSRFAQWLEEINE